MEPLQIFDSINDKHITVYVTTEVAEKCRTDTAFAQDLFNKLQDQNIEEGSAVEIETIKTEAPDGSVIEEKSDRESWSRRETLKLIKVYQKYKDKFEDHKQRKVLWTIIANELAQLHVYKTPEKCAEKWKNLLRTYRNANGKPSLPTRFQFYQEMKDIFMNTEVTISDSESNDEIEVKYKPILLNTLEGREETIEKESWSRYETLKLLKAFQKHKVLKKNFVKEKQFWAVISAELAKDNIHKPIEKCATKWKNLYRSYKKNVDKPGLPSRFHYFPEVDAVLNDVELLIPDNLMNITDDVDFEKILDPEQFRCFLQEVDFENTSKDSVSWTADETLKLIKAYKKHKHRFRKCPTKKYVWAIIASELAAEGVQKDTDKCDNKWKSLLRTYRRGATIGESPRFYFYDEMSDVLNDDKLTDGEVSTTQNDVSMTYDNSESLDNNDSLDNTDFAENEGNNDAENVNYEEIIIETEPDKPDDTGKYWSYNETAALLKAYATHREKLKDSKKKLEIWEDISQDLVASNVHKSAETCEKKWRSMFSVYKTHKLNKTGPGRFIFYKEIDDILREKIDSDVEDYVVHNRKCKCMERRMVEKQRRHIERMQLLKRKLDLEERKVEAFELYVNHLKSDSR